MRRPQDKDRKDRGQKNGDAHKDHDDDKKRRRSRSRSTSPRFRRPVVARRPGYAVPVRGRLGPPVGAPRPAPPRRPEPERPFRRSERDYVDSRDSSRAAEEAARKAREERERLDREKEKLRIERERLEREKAELLRLERERARQERERIEREREEIAAKRRQAQLEDSLSRSRAPLPVSSKRPYDGGRGGNDDGYWDDRKRGMSSQVSIANRSFEPSSSSRCALAVT